MQCPLPKTDFDVITLGHGSGGTLTSKLLDRFILSPLTNPLLDQQHDGASFTLNGRVAFSTDSYVVSPIFFPGGNIGDLAINGTLNDLAMCGAMPRYLSLSFIIEEGLPMSDFWNIIQTIKQVSEQAQIAIVTGDTKVVEKGKGDRLFINTSGIGLVHPRANIDKKRIVSGDKIIVSNAIAHHGIAIMSVREGLSFESDILSDTRHIHQEVHHLLDTFGEHIKFLRDPTRGGVATVLNEIVEGSALGIKLVEEQIPIHAAVQGACELLGLDPLFVANEGVFIAVVAPEIEHDVLQFLKQYDKTSGAFSLGYFTETMAGKVVLQTLFGGEKLVTKLIGDQLPRIC